MIKMAPVRPLLGGKEWQEPRLLGDFLLLFSILWIVP